MLDSKGVIFVYRNTVYSEDNIVNLEEYRNSSLHQKRQQEHLYRSREIRKKYKPKNQKKNKLPGYSTNQEYRGYSFSVIAFIVAITLVGLLCFGVAYCIKSGNSVTKVNPVESSYIVRD